MKALGREEFKSAFLCNRVALESLWTVWRIVLLDEPLNPISDAFLVNTVGQFSAQFRVGKLYQTGARTFKTLPRKINTIFF